MKNKCYKGLHSLILSLKTILGKNYSKKLIVHQEKLYMLKGTSYHLFITQKGCLFEMVDKQGKK